MTAGIEDESRDSFNASRYLVGVLEQTLRSGTPCRIRHPLQGDLIIYPRQRRFVATEETDLEALSKVPTNRLQITPLNESSAPVTTGREIEELLWTAAWHACAGHLPIGCSRHDVLELKHWPNLTRLPCCPDTLRLCALLSQKAHSLSLACRLLDADEESANRFYSAGLYAGILHKITQGTGNSAQEEEAEASSILHMEISSCRLGQTLRSLWKRLKGGQ